MAFGWSVHSWPILAAACLARRQAVAQPTISADAARDYLTHLAVRQKVSASTQNQALCALLFLFKEVLGTPLDDLSNGVRAKGRHLPVVLSIPEPSRCSARCRARPV